MTQDEIIEMAEQSGFSLTHSGLVKLWLGNSKDIEAFAKLVAQHEREACLKFCDEVAEYFPSSGFVGSYIGNKIRNRGEAPTPYESKVGHMFGDKR